MTHPAEGNGVMLHRNQSVEDAMKILRDKDLMKRELTVRFSYPAERTLSNSWIGGLAIEFIKVGKKI